MLIEIWEWLRGYNKWTQADAQVVFLKEEHTRQDQSGKDIHCTDITGNRLVWADAKGVRHHAKLDRSGDPSKADYSDGEAATIRYNPANPEQFYWRKLSELKVRRFFATTFTVITVAAVSIVYVWFREMLGCSR
jgi:hypothetical protein